MLSEDKKSIKIIGGETYIGGEVSLVENIDEWELDLATWQWKQLTHKEWRVFEFKRKDKEWNNLYNIRSALFALEAGWEKDYKKKLKDLTKKLGFTPNVESIKELYLPNIEHKIITMDRLKDYSIIEVEGVKIRFKEDMYSIIMTIEGSLDNKHIESIKKYLLEKLGEVEGCAYVVTEVLRDRDMVQKVKTQSNR